MNDQQPTGETTTTPSEPMTPYTARVREAIRSAQIPEVPHTPEPWDVPAENPICIGGGPGDTSIGEMAPFSPSVSTAEAAANARRAVACVNACEGINPEAVPHLLAACKAIAWGATPAAMDDGSKIADGVDWQRIEELNAAIAKAEGGAA